MDSFKCAVSKEKLRATNKTWGEKQLNRPWLVGMVSKLAMDHTFRTKEEFRDYYFESGRKRHEALSKLSEEEQYIANTVWMPENLWQTHPHIAKINYDHGRTANELKRIGDFFYGFLKETPNSKNITLTEVRYMVPYRVIGETWNGLILRELQTIKTLNDWITTRNIPVHFDKLEGSKDARYEVDAVGVDSNGRILVGIQIKPKSYSKGFEDSDKVYAMNKKKYDSFLRDYEAQVGVVYSDMKGTISNTEILPQIEKTILKAINLFGNETTSTQ